MSDYPVAIIGGGISGLATAFFLQQSGLRSIVLEKSSRLGGMIRTDMVEGCQLEAGPDSYISTKPSVTQLAAELNGLESEIIGSNDAHRRVYIVRQGQLIEMPKGMSMMVPGDLNAAVKSPLFSFETKARFLYEMFSPQRHRSGDISVEELVVSHFGKQMLEYVTEPLLSGVYGGDSAQLSAESVLPRFLGYERDFGSLIRGVRREQRAPGNAGSLFLSFRCGMQTLTDALSQAISGRVEHTRATAVNPAPGGWQISADGRQLQAAHVVLAIPAYAAAELINNSIPELASELSAIPYSSAILVTLVYRKTDVVIPEGFGFLVPRRERRTIAASTFVGTKWPSRIPADRVALRAFIVDPEAPRLLETPDRELLQLVRDDFNRILNISADPLLSRVERWPNSMPQYVVGHGARQVRIAETVSQSPGLHLAGNAYNGVGVPDCVRLAKETANTIASLVGSA
ncbi:MAG: protoporphyrinogen oxidase [Acidobacteriaceae bacterium]|nr:protoporphyrinogen oxidase [Acidobacteriaceae bacterium]